MSHTIPVKFEGTPTLTPAKVASFKDWYVDALANADMSMDLDDNCYYQGYSDAMESTLGKLYGMSKNVAEKVDTSKGSIIRPLIIVGAVGTAYLVWKNWDEIKKEIKNF